MPKDPNGHEIPTGWTVVRIEEHGKEKIEISYLYLCPCDMTTTTSKQVPLFGKDQLREKIPIPGDPK